jgi:hypothetical protein
MTSSITVIACSWALPSWLDRKLPFLAIEPPSGPERAPDPGHRGSTVIIKPVTDNP